MTRYLAYSRRELRGRFRVWLNRNRSVVGVVALGALILNAFTTVIFRAAVPPTDFGAYALGALHAGTVVVLSCLLWTAFLAHDGGAIFQMRGAWGEENTRSELARAKRRRLIWGWVDSVTVATGDIDHLVITRSGGVVALDSKWRSDGNPAQHEEMARAAQRARVRASGVMRTLMPTDRGGHRAPGMPHDVRPAVVVWGAMQRQVPHGAHVDGVPFVPGRSLLSWLRALDGDPVDRDAARDLLRRVEEFRASSWKSHSS